MNTPSSVENLTIPPWQERIDVTFLRPMPPPLLRECGTLPSQRISPAMLFLISSSSEHPFSNEDIEMKPEPSPAAAMALSRRLDSTHPVSGSESGRRSGISPSNVKLMPLSLHLRAKDLMTALATLFSHHDGLA